MNQKLLGVIALASLISLSFISCSDDETTTPPGDTTAPFVVTFDPMLNATAVATDEEIIIIFSEAMDPQSASGNVSLSPGIVNSLTWDDDRTLKVGHIGWAEGTEVTVTVSTGLEDVAGNGLAAPASSRFWTETSVVSLLTTIPEDLTTDVTRNDLVQMLFSHRMNLGTVQSATIATDLDASQGLPFTVDNGEANWVILTFDSILPENSEIEILVGTGAQSEGGTNLAAPERFTFTTGIDTDTDPPMLVSVEPADGSVISPSTGFIRFTFDEPLNIDEFNPSKIGAQFQILFSQVGEPTWSNGNSVITVALPTPLPDGLPIVIHFDTYQDVPGNVQTTPIEYEVVVSGTADYFPATDGLEFTFDTYWVDKDSTGATIDENTDFEYVGITGVSATEFNRVEYEDETFTTDRGWDSYQDVGTAINFTGFTEKDGLDTEVFTFVPPVQFIRLPWATQSWSGMTEAQSSGGSFDVDLTIDVTGPEDVQAQDTSGPIDEGRVWWIGCWKLVLGFELKVGGVTQQSGSQTFWFAPTIGVVQEVDDEQQDDGGSEESESYLQLTVN